ncbi:hypothetical protein [Vibrio phage VP16T]|nr:hypothetical protein [Vibrio phage VP16T]
MLTKIKIIYWRWVVACCLDDLADIDAAWPYLCPRARVDATKEQAAITKDLIEANDRLRALGVH